MIDESLVKQCGIYGANDETLKVELSKELLANYISLIEQNAELYKENAKLKVLLDDVYALGFLTESFDSGKSHRDVCKAYEKLKPYNKTI